MVLTNIVLVYIGEMCSTGIGEMKCTNKYSTGITELKCTNKYSTGIGESGTVRLW